MIFTITCLGVYIIWLIFNVKWKQISLNKRYQSLVNGHLKLMMSIGLFLLGIIYRKKYIKPDLSKYKLKVSEKEC